MDLTLDQLMMNADRIRRDYSRLTRDFIKASTLDNWIPAVNRIKNYLGVKAEEPMPAEWHTSN